MSDDLTGKDYHRWHVLGPGPPRKSGKTWRCKCKCGKIRTVVHGNLVNDKSTQCVRCSTRRASTKHGHTCRKRGKVHKTSEYQSWSSLSKKRVRDQVVDRWRGTDGFLHFLADMGKKPRPKHVFRLRRKDLAQPFGPDNCFWEKWRDEVPTTYHVDGVPYTLAELAWSAGMNAATLKRRIEGGFDPADAITIPLSSNVKYLTAFGETKKICEWLADSRCKVSSSLLRKRLSEKWDHEAALATLPWQLIVAFGEEKTVYGWSHDLRLGKGVSEKILRNRLREGWDAEKAIADPVPPLPRYLAFNTRKTLVGWVKDIRCVFRESVPKIGKRIDIVRDRQRRGWSLERCLTRSVDRHKYIEAFGERKTVRDWVSDQRCVVSRTTLQGRIRRGWDGEEAVTEPEVHPGSKRPEETGAYRP